MSSVILRRLDKKPDRVEISEEQLVQATVRAEELAAEFGRPLRVVGWYHSHPHITVWPSHVGNKLKHTIDSWFVVEILKTHFEGVFLDKAVKLTNS